MSEEKALKAAKEIVEKIREGKICPVVAPAEAWASIAKIIQGQMEQEEQHAC